MQEKKKGKKAEQNERERKGLKRSKIKKEANQVDNCLLLS